MGRKGAGKRLITNNTRLLMSINAVRHVNVVAFTFGLRLKNAVAKAYIGKIMDMALFVIIIGAVVVGKAKRRNYRTK